MEKYQKFINEERRENYKQFNDELPLAASVQSHLPPSAPPLPPADGPPPPYPADTNHHEIQKPEEQKSSSNLGTEDVQQPQIIADGTSTVIIVPEGVEVGSTLVLVSGMDFSEKAIRLGFVRKVFGIVLVQLLITAVVIWLIRQSPNFIAFVLKIKWIAIGFPMFVYIFTFLLMLWNEGLRKKVPYNYIVLLLFTLSLASLLGIATNRVGDDVMLMAGLTTFLLVAALTLFAFQTTLDFTFLSCSCLTLFLLLLFFGFAVMIVPNKVMSLLYTIIVIVITSIYIVWDIQLIIGGNHRCSISPEDYVFAALILYYDIVLLFIRILRSRQ